MADKKRVQFDFTPDALQRLDDLQGRVGASTKAEVVRDSLRVYEWFATQVNPNHTLEIRDEHGELVYRIPVKTLLS